MDSADELGLWDDGPDLDVVQSGEEDVVQAGQEDGVTEAEGSADNDVAGVGDSEVESSSEFARENFGSAPGDKGDDLEAGNHKSFV